MSGATSVNAPRGVPDGVRRLGTAWTPVEHPGSRAEWPLATARSFLATCALVAIYLDPTEPTRYAPLAYAILLAYALYSLGILAWLRWGTRFPALFAPGLQAIDLLFAVVLTLFTEGVNSPFFVLFVFVLLSAAWRWGLRAALVTAGGAVVLLATEGLLAVYGGILGRVDTNRFVIRASYLLLIGGIVGYLAEKEKRASAESAAITRLVARVRAEAGLSRALRAVADEVLNLLDAGQIVLALRNTVGGQVVVWESRRTARSGRAGLRLRPIEAPDAPIYFADLPAPSWIFERGRRTGERQALFAGRGDHLERLDVAPPAGLLEPYGFDTVFSVPVTLAEEWLGRVFVMDPRAAGAPRTLAFLRTLAEQVGPAVHNVYLAQRLRSRLRAAERARVARELHDGVIQSLYGLEMRIDVLRRRQGSGQDALVAELQALQQVLRDESVRLRAFMEHLRPPAVDAGRLLPFLADMSESFGHATGIATHFTTDLEHVALPPRVCREIARIAQESLLNVHKHARASTVRIDLTVRNGLLRLAVEDDGRGFGFTGRQTLENLDHAGLGPRVIKERVRAIHGQLVIESSPTRGARLEILVPHASAR